MNAARSLCGGLLVATAGCAGRATQQVASSNQNFCPKSSATVYVTNDNWLDMVIYVSRNGSRYRLGEVTGVQSAVFRIPEATMGAALDLRLIADPIGCFSDNRGPRNDCQAGFVTPNIMMAPGHTIIDMRLHNIIAHSTVSVGVEDPEEI
jgi:hypothetical protein